MSDMTTAYDEAVKAGLAALRGITPETTDEAFVGALVAAAAPILLAAERRRIATEIWAEVDAEWPNDEISMAYKNAARIAEEAP